MFNEIIINIEIKVNGEVIVLIEEFAMQKKTILPNYYKIKFIMVFSQRPAPDQE